MICDFDLFEEHKLQFDCSFGSISQVQYWKVIHICKYQTTIAEEIEAGVSQWLCNIDSEEDNTDSTGAKSCALIEASQCFC